MRVTGGIYKNRKLITPAGDAVRPTSDRMRQSLFNMLRHAKWATDITIDGAHCLDLFCGSGALGIEALSQGAAHCIFVDTQTSPVTHNTAFLPTGAYTVIRQNALNFIPGASHLFNLVFMDPPYNKNLIAPVLNHLCDQKCLADGAFIIIETEKNAPMPACADTEIIDQRNQGISTLHILRYNAPVNQGQ